MYRSPAELEQLLLAENALLVDAVRALDERPFGVVVVVDGAGRLRGIFTNGDFRRAILRGGSLSEPVASAMNRTPIVFHLDTVTADTIEDTFRRCSVRHIPLIDAEGIVRDVVFLQDLADSGVLAARGQGGLGCDVVVMAGGLGSRLDPFTRVLPKPLIPIGDKPILQIILDRFMGFGARHFFISINHKRKMIKAYFEELGSAYDLSFVEEDSPLGTAGALSLLRDRIDEPFFLTNCDILISCDYTSILASHKRSGRVLTIVGSLKQHTIPYGVCEIENGGKLARLVEKPRYELLVNTGMYVVSPEVLRLVPDNQYFDMTSLIEAVLREGGEIGVYPVSERAWMDVGQWEEYHKTIRSLGPV